MLVSVRSNDVGELGVLISMVLCGIERESRAPKEFIKLSSCTSYVSFGVEILTPILLHWL